MVLGEVVSTLAGVYSEAGSMKKKPRTLEEAEKSAQRIARMIDPMLPEGWGFCLLLMNYNMRPDVGRLNYISNVDRKAVPDMLRELLRQWGEEI